MRLAGLRVADDPAPWAALGFAVSDGALSVGGVAIALDGGAGGITGWHVEGLRSSVLPVTGPVAADVAEHPNGVCAVDHVVAFTPDFDGTVEALAADGLPARRVRDAGGGVRQAFYVLETALLELAGPVEGALRFWGITFVVPDADALKERLGERLGEVKDAVQPGRRIVSVRREAGLGVPLAFITPR